MAINIKNVFKSKVAQNSMWLIVLQGFNTIIPLITLPYITRILSKSAYGEFSLALNWIGYFQVIVEYGFGLTGARKVAMRKTDKELSIIHSNIMFSRLLLMVGCIVGFYLVLPWLPFEHSQILCMMILFLMIFATVFQQTWLFQGIAEMKNITVINVICRTISVIFIFLFVKTPSDLYLYCFLYIFNYVLVSLIGCVVVRKKYKVKLIFNGMKNIILEIKDGWYLFISTAITKIFGSIGITILGFISTTGDVGVYSAINKIPYVLTLLFSAISQTMYPYCCMEFSKSFEAGICKVKKVAIPVVISFSLIAFVIMIFHNPIVIILFGDEYAKDSMLLVLFAAWVLFGILNNFMGVQILVASGHQKEYSHAFMKSVILMLVLMLLLGYYFTSYGIAISSLTSEMFLSCLLIMCLKKIKKNINVS